MRLEDNVQIVVAAHDHVFPLGHGWQTDVGDGRLGRDLVGVLISLFRQVEILLVDVYATGATGNGLFGDAHKRQVGVYCHGLLDSVNKLMMGVRQLTLVELSAKGSLGGAF